MALQGDLSSFALPDVLRLLAGTGKSGRLGRRRRPRLRRGLAARRRLVGRRRVTSSPHATDAADLVFELLRFDGGSFVFDDGDSGRRRPSRRRRATPSARPRRWLGEWAEVEAVVPSIALLGHPRPRGRRRGHRHRRRVAALAALGGGRTVADLGDRFELTDLAASPPGQGPGRAGLVEVEAPPPRLPAAGRRRARRRSSRARGRVGRRPARPSLERPASSAEDGPVVLEAATTPCCPSRCPARALLRGRARAPAPSTAARFDASEPPTTAPRCRGRRVARPRSSRPSRRRATAPASPAGRPRLGDASPRRRPRRPGRARRRAERRRPAPPTAAGRRRAATRPPRRAATTVDDDRGSLLKFLSTVKP